jgi:histone H3/H4
VGLSHRNFICSLAGLPLGITMYLRNATFERVPMYLAHFNDEVQCTNFLRNTKLITAMSESARKRSRITPRNSTANPPVDAQTPFQDVCISHINSTTDLTSSQLHQLGKLLRKPTTATPQSANRVVPTTTSQRAFSSGGRSTPRGTPGATPSNLRSIVRPRRGPPTTPHGIRAQQLRQTQRNAGNTPARDRRRSGRFMRDTPRDDLRMLSRALAGKSKRTSASPQTTGRRSRRTSRAASIVGDEGSPAPQPPRLSLSRRELADDDDSFHERPPRLSVPLDEYEVEDGRREYRRERESFGNLRLSDFHDIAEEIIEETDEEELQDVDMEDDLSHLEPADNETTRNLRALIEAEQQQIEDEEEGQSFAGNTDGEPTFQFNIAERSRLSNIYDMEAAEGADEPDDDLPMFMGDNDDVMSQASSDHGAAFNEQFAGEGTRIIPNSSPGPQSPVRNVPKLNTRTAEKKPLKRSRFGLEYPSLPSAVIKKLASGFSRSFGGNGKINKETLVALTDASDWFFEQVSEDLAAYADHARRKRIEEADVITLMKR